MKDIKKILVDLWIRAHADKERLFTNYYKKNTWGDPESRSGTGSTLEHTARLRAQLPGFFQKYRIKSLLDAPCGDFNWFQRVEKGDLRYIGGDIVLPLIDENKKRFANATTEFLHLDIINDKLPRTDLWLCRDVLFHFSENDIFVALCRFVESETPWILTTTFPEHETNKDIPTGSFRLLNLEKPPFNFGPPADSLIDSVEGWQKRTMGLWDRDSVIQVLRENNKL